MPTHNPRAIRRSHNAFAGETITGEKLRLLPDIPWGEGLKKPDTAAAQDGLRFHQYAEILARAALDTPEPFTIGVYGGWGSGKTSLMRMIMKVVELEPGAIPVWFNAWRYEKEEHLIVPLLATIITAMTEHQSKWEKMKTAGNKLLAIFRSVLYGVSVSGKLAIPGLAETELKLSPKDMIDRHDAITAASEPLLEQSLYFHSFARLDEIMREANVPRIVIFVDDLDRCFPNKAVALLEGIKLVLNQPNISFVLGVAPDIIQAYLREKYKREYNIPERLYEDYLEKLVQLAFPVPEISENVPDFVRGLLKRRDVFGRISDKQFKEEYEPLVSICGPACKDNPRAIVRFLNRLLIMRKVHEAKERARKKEQRYYSPLSISLVHFGITNALELKWQAVLQACERNQDITIEDEKTREAQEKPLCECFLDLFDTYKTPEQDNALVNALLEIAKDESCREKAVFDTLASDKSLRMLLKSKPGREWLQTPELRRAVKSASKELAPEPEARHEPRYIVSWAEDYSPDGWPLCRGYEIKPLADLRGANLSRANLEGANLLGVNLSSANLEGANLRGAYLVDVNLMRACLSIADLAGADLRYTNLDRANLKGARYDDATRWPEGFDPQAAGAVKVERDAS